MPMGRKRRDFLDREVPLDWQCLAKLNSEVRSPRCRQLLLQRRLAVKNTLLSLCSLLQASELSEAIFPYWSTHLSKPPDTMQFEFSHPNNATFDPWSYEFRWCEGCAVCHFLSPHHQWLWLLDGIAHRVLQYVAKEFDSANCVQWNVLHIKKELLEYS